MDGVVGVVVRVVIVGDFFRDKVFAGFWKGAFRHVACV